MATYTIDDPEAGSSLSIDDPEAINLPTPTKNVLQIRESNLLVQ